MNLTRKTWLRHTVVASFIILLPIVFGICFWDELPQTVVTHWGADGTPNGYSSKAVAVFIPTLFIFASHWICSLVTMRFSNFEKQSPKAVLLVLWLMPAISIFCNVMVYTTAMGKNWNISAIAPILFGLLFIALGNYMPKIRQNAVYGIKLPWTLRDEENWNKTHRLAGKVWTIGGAVQMLAAFVPQYAFAVFISVTVILVLVPSVYSYCLYRKKGA